MKRQFAIVGFFVLSIFSFSTFAQQSLSPEKLSTNISHIDLPPPGVLPPELEKKMISNDPTKQTASFHGGDVQPSSLGPLTLTDTTKPIHLQDGQQTLIIRLKSNPTTGYGWFLKTYDQNLLKLQSHRYVAPTTNMAGAPGIEEWVFYVEPYAFIAPQVSEIHFVYARPWDLSNAKDLTIQWIS